MFIDFSFSQNQPKPGEYSIRRCGNYFEYCNGCCNSCHKNNFTISDHTIALKHSIVSDRTSPYKEGDKYDI